MENTTEKIMSPETRFAAGPSLGLETRVVVAYPVHFTRELFHPANPLLAAVLADSPEPLPHRCLCAVDGGLAAADPDLVRRIEAYFQRESAVLTLVGAPLVLPGGEAGKNSFEIPHKLLRAARQAHLSRQSFLLAVGGGAFLDAAGFAAALIHRGVRLVRVPTTVLAQNDSGIGVKNGLNLGGVKNFLGTFAPPAAVINDFSLLRTLPDRDWIAGVAEAFKVAIIKDMAFLEWLIGAAARIPQRDEAVMEELIRRCAALHLEHIGCAGDPFETGTARPLDFGHWSAHKLESLSCHELRHGEAVGIGIALDLLYAAALGKIVEGDAQRIIGAMLRAGLPIWHVALELRDPAGRLFVFSGIEEFREHLGGRLAITLPCPLGSKCEVDILDEAVLVRCLTQLQAINPQVHRAG